MTSGPTYGPVDPLVSTIRYTSLADLKQRLNLENTTEWDSQLTTAAITAEIGLDRFNSRSFPDTGTDPEIAGIPEDIKNAAFQAALGVFALGDAPLGIAGSEEFIGQGVQTISDVIRRAAQDFAPGYRVRFPMGGES